MSLHAALRGTAQTAFERTENFFDAFFGGIDNLTDRDPPRVGVNPGQTAAAGITNPQYYDVLGRRYYMSVTLSL